jgi:hypothetical protein
MTCRTKSNVSLPTLQTVAASILGPNPYRKAFLLTPIPGGVSATPVIAAVFGAGAGQQWQVPVGVTQIIDAYTWGSGGSGDNGQAGTGGGGGGGSGFSTTGPLTVVPGTVFAIAVDASNGQGITTITDPTGTLKAQANSGKSGAAAVGGAAGGAGTGIITKAGGAGGTSGNAKGAGGGGAGGNNANGGAGNAVQTGGTGGGATTILTYGKGGVGGTGGSSPTQATPGNSPGAGGGGGFQTGGTLGAGADGLAVIFMLPSAQQSAISISKRPSVTAGLGTLNFMLPNIAPLLISDDWIGNAVTDEWFGVSGVAGVQIEITEYSYFTEDVDPAY